MSVERLKRASQAITAQRKDLAAAIAVLEYKVPTGEGTTVDNEAHEKLVRDVSHHLTYLAEALAVADPILFIDYVGWIKSLSVGSGDPDDVLVMTLESMVAVLNERLAPDLASLAASYITAGLERVTEASGAVPSFLPEDAPLASLAREYLAALLAGERHVASCLVLDAVESGTYIKDVYLHVFQRSQYEIGRLWQMNRVTVAQEHYCTAATQLIMSQLYPHLFSMDRIGRRLVATCAGDELHELGVRMVADFFEMEGWDTYYLGANVPADSILQACVDNEADLLAISATMVFHVQQVADTIERIRTSLPTGALKILVGGYPFNIAPDLWRKVGADGHALDALGAVKLAGQLLENDNG
ncbi:MAG: cobalamin-dependent protein [Anaerolineae bacterium]|jgi:methanogenic corrinoid protein MtbC1